MNQSPKELLENEIYRLLNLNPYDMPWFGGITRFHDVPYDNILKIIDLMHTSAQQSDIISKSTIESTLNDQFNNTPCINDMLKLTKSRQEHTVFSGFVEHPERIDNQFYIYEFTTLNKPTDEKHHDIIPQIIDIYQPDEIETNENDNTIRLWWD